MRPWFERSNVAVALIKHPVDAAEHPPEVRGDGKTAKARTLAGDDFQPIFIFMVCACEIPDLTATCQVSFCPKSIANVVFNHAGHNHCLYCRLLNVVPASMGPVRSDRAGR